MYGRMYRNYTEYIQKLYRNLTGHFLDKNRIDFFHRARAKYTPNCQVDANISENDDLLSKLEETFGLH